MLIGPGMFIALLIISELWAMMANLGIKILLNPSSAQPLTLFSFEPSFIVPLALAIGITVWMAISSHRTKQDLDLFMEDQESPEEVS